MSDVNEAVIRVRVLLHEAEVDVTMGNEEGAKTNLEEIRMMLDRLASGGPLMPGGVEDEAPEEDRHCDSCSHEDLDHREVPCCNCEYNVLNGEDLWESKIKKTPEPEVQEVPSYKTCETCNYGSEIDGGPSDEDECRACGDKKANWETA